MLWTTSNEHQNTQIPKLLKRRSVGSGVVGTAPVAAAPPATVDPEIKVVHHRVLQKVDNTLGDFIGLRESTRVDGGSLEFRLEVGL